MRAAPRHFRKGTAGTAVPDQKGEGRLLGRRNSKSKEDVILGLCKKGGSLGGGGGGSGLGRK